MIIPIKCFTCGFVLADKYRYYQEKARERKVKDNIPEEKIVYLTKELISNHALDKTANGQVLDDLKIFRPCCRQCMLTHVDIM